MNTSFLSAVLIATALPLQMAAAGISGIAAGGYHFVGLDAGRVVGLGDGTYGQLGSQVRGIPVPVSGLTEVKQVAAGVFSTIALKTDGSVWFLGDYQIQHPTPHGTPRAVTVPVQIGGLAGIDLIAAGHRHFLALDTDTGTLCAWGSNSSGQLGDGRLRDLSTAVEILTGVRTMAAGDGFSVAVKSNGEVWTWGRNTHGQLGLGDTADRHFPTRVPAVAHARAAAAGGNHLLVLLADGTVMAAGDNRFGQLGTASAAESNTLVSIPGLAGISRISAGWNQSAAHGGLTYMWGRNFEGQCGGGSMSPTRLDSPTVITLPSPILAVSCGGNFTLFETADHSVWGTGSNGDGQLDGHPVAGPGDSGKVLEPVLIPGHSE